jgi:plastocyanin
MMFADSGANRAVSARTAVVVLVLFASVFVTVASGTHARVGGGATVPSARTSAHTHVVEIRGFEFHPAVLHAARGDTVVWVNRDVVAHTATAPGGEWSTGNIAAGGSAQRVLGSAADGGYFCIYHPSMQGKLTVRGGERAASQ